jgi:hypothetical protein
VNVCEALWPWFSVRVSKLPSFAVAVCGCCPLFVQVIVSPTLTVTDPGEKRKSAIVTPGSPAAWATRCAERTCRTRSLRAWGLPDGRHRALVRLW